jgi:hypothetical protein
MAIVEKKIVIGDLEYLVTDKQPIHEFEELIFELKINGRTSYVRGMADDLLGSPIKKVWKILEVS